MSSRQNIKVCRGRELNASHGGVRVDEPWGPSLRSCSFSCVQAGQSMLAVRVGTVPSPNIAPNRPLCVRRIPNPANTCRQSAAIIIQAP